MTTMWHLSATDLGRSVVLRPRLPRDPMVGEEATIPRISVAPTIEGCLIALRGCFYNRGLWRAYRLAAGPDPIEPLRVPDAGATGEMWLLSSGLFVDAGLVAGNL